MQRRVFLGTMVSVVAAAGGIRAEELRAKPVENITILLDCSLSMRGSFPIETGEGDAGLSSSRLVEAKAAVVHLMNELAIDGKHKVGLWLYGHRLNWEPGAVEPKLIEQTKYFEHSLGFQVLETLLPGDDIEVVRAPGVLEPKHLPAVEATLAAVEPWGEDPQFLALRQAIESLPRNGNPSERRVLLITDGGNQQGMARFHTTKDNVIDALRKHAVPVHIVYVGRQDELPRQTASDLSQIARASEGKVHTVATVAELSKALEIAVSPPGAVERTSPARLEPVSTGAAVALKAVTVQGKVTYYKKPVKGATVALKSDGPERSVKTDAAGLFTLADVAAGNYELAVSVVIKNKIRDAVRPVVVPGTSDQPIDVTIDLE